MKRFRLYLSLLALMALALLSPCGVAVQLIDCHGGKKAESESDNSLGSGMTTGLSSEPDTQSYYRRATVGFTVNPFISQRISTATVVTPPSVFLFSSSSSAQYESPDSNCVNPRAPPCRSVF